MMSPKKNKHQPDTPSHVDHSPPPRTASYRLRPRNPNGQVEKSSCKAQELSSSVNEQLLSRCCDPKVVLEDISHLCETVQSPEEDSPVANHSANPLLAKDKAYLNSFPERSELAWPPMSDSPAWASFEESVMKQLSPASHHLSVGARIQLLESTIYDCASTAFGQKSPSLKQTVSHYVSNKYKVIKLVREKNDLLTKIELSCNPVEKKGLQALLEDTRLKLRKLRRKENRRRRSFLRKQERRRFKTNPYQCGKDLLSPRNFTKLSLPTEKLDEILHSLHSDPDKDTPLPFLDGLPDPPSVKVKFDSSSFSSSEFDAVIRSRRNGSRPGPNNVPYKVYKKCPDIAKYLFKLCLDCLRLKRVPLQWRMAFKTFIPKVDEPDSSKFSDFRDIALLNVEGKIFFSLVSKRFYRHIIDKNKFIDSSIQKGCMENIPGCWEHIAMIWDGLKDARLNQKDLVTIWLDIANAYGSIAHQLIFLALRRYGIPDKWITIIETYYSGLWSKSTSENAKSNWHRHEKGIFTGCCISIILFLAGMNIIIEYICNTSAEGFLSSSKVLMPLVRGFMDDLNLLTVGVDDAKILLGRASDVLIWARMAWRLKKSRYLVLIKGRVSSEASTSTSFEGIPSIAQKPVRCLGKTMDGSISDSKGSVWLEDKIVGGLIKLDKSFLLGSSKVWVLQFLLLPQIRSIITIYEIPFSTVERLEKRVSKYIRKWLGFHPSISSLALYSKSSPCPLPFTSLSSLFKTSKTSAHLQLRDSKDPIVASTVPVLETGRKWSVSESVQDAESILRFKKILGHTQTGRAGLGYTPIEQIPVKGSKDYRKAVSDIVSNIHDQIQVSSKDSQRLQLNWTTWSNYIRNDLSWKCIWAFGPQLLRFCVQSCFNTLPSPNNCVRWNFSEDKSCVLCKAPLCTLPHILSGCKFSLNNKRWNYRHDCVLKVLLEGLEELIKEKRNKTLPSKLSYIKFVKPGHGRQGGLRKSFGLLDRARDWVLLADIGSCKLVFPTEIFSTSERPDIVIYSIRSKTVILIENTSGCEENQSENHDLKTKKYSDLVDAIRANGWVCHIFAIEVGARGFNSTHVPFCLKSLGFLPKSVKSLLGKMSQAALKGSYQIWLARNDRAWNPPLVEWKTSFGPQITTPSAAQPTIQTEPPSSQAEVIDFVISPCSPDEQSSKQPLSAPKATPSSLLEPSEKTEKPAEQSSKKPKSASKSIRPSLLKPSAKSSKSEKPNKQSSKQPKSSSKSIRPSLIKPSEKAEKTDEQSSKQSKSSKSEKPKSEKPNKQSLKQPPGVSKTSRSTSIKPSVKTPFRRPWLGLRNKSSTTCYANAVLNCLFPFPELWDFSSRLPLHQALKLMIIAMNTQPRHPSKATPLDPKRFLESLAKHISSSQTGFVYRQQHDAAEILGYVLNDLISAGLDRKLVCYSLFTTYRCQKCGSNWPAHTNDVAEQILNLNVQESVVSALITRLSGDVVTVRCKSCKSDQQCVEQLAFSELPELFVMRLRRDQFEGRLGQEVYCDRKLSIGADEVDLPLVTYHLTAVVHHIGRSLSSGHYTTTLIDPQTNDMWNYNDEAVKEVKRLNQETAYILIYKKEK